MRAWPFDPDVDRREARLAPSARRLLLADTRRIVIVGAGGWIGRTVIALLHEALGARAFAERVVCFGSRANTLDVDDGLCVQVRPLADLVGRRRIGPDRRQAHGPEQLLGAAAARLPRRRSPCPAISRQRSPAARLGIGVPRLARRQWFNASPGAATRRR